MMFLWVKCSSFRVLGMLRGPLNLVHTFHAAQLPGKKMKIIIRGRTPHLMCSHLAWTLQTLPLKTARL